MCLWANYKKKYKEKYNFFCILKVTEERSGIRSWIRSRNRIHYSESESAPKCHGSPTLTERITHRSWYRLTTNFLRADLSRLGVAATAARFVGSLALYSTTWRAEHETSLLQGKDTAWRSTPISGGLSMRPACSKVGIQPGALLQYLAG
jgi:hypothetical protein